MTPTEVLYWGAAFITLELIMLIAILIMNNYTLTLC